MARTKKRGSKIYAVCLSAYILILAIAIVFGLTKVWGYAEEYEGSRPNKTMDEYVAALSKNLWDDSIAQVIAEMPHEVQSDDECAEIVKAMLSEGISYIRVGGNNSDAMTVNYKLRCGGSVFGEVSLMEDESKADEVEYGLLPWVVYKEEFDFTGLYSSMQITVPAAYTVELNGVKLSSDYIIEEGIRYDVLEDYYKDYPDLPTKVTYKFDNIIGHLEPAVYDEDGNEVVIDETQDDSQFLRPVGESQMARFRDFSNAFMERYRTYISGIYDPTYGYQRLLPYIKLGSELDERMKLSMDGISWAHTASVTIDSVVLNNAIYLGDGVYIIDVSSDYTAQTPRGEEKDHDDMKIIVTDTGNDIRAVSLTLY